MFPDDGFVEVKAYTEEYIGLLGDVRDDTHSIGLVTGVIICWSTISCRCFSIASLHLIGTFLLAC